MKLRQRWLPRPLLSFVLFITWLLLNNSAAPGHIVLGLLLALLIPIASEPLQTKQAKVVYPLKLVKYFILLIGDIVIANLRVAKLILGPTKSLRPGFIALPLELTGDLPITLLASTISLTPGTLSADLSEDRQWLYIHALYIDDEQGLIDEIKGRYEQPLKEIFQC